ncbi:MAG: type II CRISPR RNA-guided endonuclease Cas9 [Christensenellales bacterium]
MHYRIGLDVGIGSVGWAVLEDDPITGEPVRIENLGVRTFSPNETEKGGSTAEARRLLRGVRRRNRRKKFRELRLRSAILNTLGVDIQNELNVLINQDVYELRAKALDERISDLELAKVLTHIFKRRGFKSSRKSLVAKDEGDLLKSISSNLAYLLEKGYRTIGEMFYKDDKFKTLTCGKVFYNIRNHSGDYRNCFTREELLKEIKLILTAQKTLGNEKINDQFIERVIEIFDSQRNFDEGPSKGKWHTEEYDVGTCTFIHSEPRAPKASYTFELFNALSRINDLKIDGEALTLDQKQKLYRIVESEKELKFEKVRKVLQIEENRLFNLCRYKTKKDDEKTTEKELVSKSEHSVFVSMKNSYEIRKAIWGNSDVFKSDTVDEIARILSMNKSDVRIENAIKNSAISLTRDAIENLKTIDVKNFGSLSIVAMKRIIPFLYQGLRYDKACQSAGFDHSSFEHPKQKLLNGEFIEKLLQDVTNNVVKRSVRQTLRIVNEIIKKYGSPQFLTIELARDLSRTKKERKEIEGRQKKRAEDNDDIVKKLQEEFKINHPTGQDILKFRLYEEQKCKCMYSDRKIEIERLFEPNYVQIDHILPISRSFDDSYNNKVLVISSENQNKGDRTPYEFFGSDEKRWKEFEARANMLNNVKKRRNLLKKKFGKEEQEEFISRNINDTRYISRLLLNTFQNNLLMDESMQDDPLIKKKNIKSINGAVTDYLRKCWNINKVRENGDIHHAIDACVIAVASEKEIQKVTKYNQLKEKFCRTKDGLYISKITGELMSEEEKDKAEKANLSLLTKKLDEPYDNFINELKLRGKVKYFDFNFNEEEKLSLAKFGYTDEQIDRAKPVFISRMKTTKKTGAISKDTIMSTREYKETGKLIKSEKLSKLKIVAKPESVKLKDDPDPNCSIAGYYHPQDDRLLYLKLKKYLIEHGKIEDNITIHKPRKDGSDGPIVKTVKKYEPCTSCVKIRSGAAENGSMYRVDLFEKDNKYYFIPVYMSDVYNKKLPNKVVVQNKPWQTIDESFKFLFSLYGNDLIKIKSKNPVCLKAVKKTIDKPDQIENNEILAYFNCANISTASFTVYSHDKCYSIDGLGIKTLQSIEKCYVDIMGKVYSAPTETREKL